MFCIYAQVSREIQGHMVVPGSSHVQHVSLFLLPDLMYVKQPHTDVHSLIKIRLRAVHVKSTCDASNAHGSALQATTSNTHEFNTQHTRYDESKPSHTTPSSLWCTQEVAVGKDKFVPFLLETEMRAKGAEYSSGADWSVHAIADGKLITGQNPQSSSRVAELIVEALKAPAVKA